jgi:hypothetical protein
MGLWSRAKSIGKGTAKIMTGDVGGGVSDLAEGAGLSGDLLGTGAPALDPLKADAARQAELYQLMRDELAMQRGGLPPEMQAATIDPVERAQAAEVAPVERAQAATLGAAPERVAADEIAATPDVQALTVGGATAEAAKIAAPERIAAQQVQTAAIDPIERALAERADAERISAARAVDTSGLGADQRSLIRTLQARAAGEAPSAAEIALQRALERQNAQAYGLAASARGANKGLAMRNAARIAQENEQAAASQMAEARAREMESATTGLSSALQGARGQELELTTLNARLAQEAAQSNQGAGNQMALANMQAGNQASLANAQAANARAVQQAQLSARAGEANQDATLRAALANQAAGNQVNLSQAELEQQARQANMSRSMQASLANQDSGLRAALANQSTSANRAQTQAQLNLRAGEGNADRLLQATTTEAQMRQQAALANAGATNERSGQQAALTQQAALANAGAANDRSARQAALTQQAGEANLGAATTFAGQRIQDRQNAMSNVLDASRQQSDANRAILDATEAGKARRAQLAGSLIGAAGQAGAAAAVSDRRAKTDIVDLLRSDEHGDPLGAFLSRLHPYAYRYRDPADGEGPRVGVMAQDLERTPVGETMVTEDATGKKQIDTAAAVGVTLAALAKMRQEMDDMKRRARR